MSEAKVRRLALFMGAMLVVAGVGIIADAMAEPSATLQIVAGIAAVAYGVLGAVASRMKGQ